MLTLGFAGFFASSFLPETLGQPIPQTPLDAENFLLGVPYFSYRGKKFWRCRTGKVDDMHSTEENRSDFNEHSTNNYGSAMKREFTGYDNPVSPVLDENF